MKLYKLTLITLALAGIPMLGNAQRHKIVNIHLDGTGGIGNTTPWGANAKVEINTAKLDLKPYFGIKGVTKYSSDELISMDYTYTGIMPLSSTSSLGKHYTSEYQGHRKGTEMEYGVELKYHLSAADLLAASIKGTRSNLSQSGLSHEALWGSNDALISSGSWRTNNPLLRENTLEAMANYQHRDANGLVIFNLKYSYLRNFEDEERNLEAEERYNFDVFSKTRILADATTQRHNALAQWNRNINGHDLGWGVRYENQLISANDAQEFFNLQPSQQRGINEPQSQVTFSHNYHTAGVFANYTWNPVKEMFWVNAGIEYDYTRMGKQNLHDYIPRASLEWRPARNNSFVLSYNRRITRPTVAYLNPARVHGVYTMDFGNEDLTGIHINLFNLRHNIQSGNFTVTTNLQHIRVDDGFCAIWMERDGIRQSTWKNEGVRRAWSLTPEVKWKASVKTNLQARANVIWDKRVAYAINMAKEHWGYSAGIGLNQVLPLEFLFNATADYSYGNTIDLYSHAGTSWSLGANLKRKIWNNVTAQLDYRYNHYPETILTQGAYTGTFFARPKNHNSASLTINIDL